MTPYPMTVICSTCGKLVVEFVADITITKVTFDEVVILDFERICLPCLTEVIEYDTIMFNRLVKESAEKERIEIPIQTAESGCDARRKR